MKVDFIIVALALFAIPVSLLAQTRNLPPRLQLSGEITAQGTPEVLMWKAGMPKADIDGAGFPILKNAQHTLIFKDAVEAGGYNHHPQIFHHAGTFYGAWSNHPKGEDSAGQRVLISTSKDGLKWEDWREAIPPPSPVRGWKEGFGSYAVAGPWCTYEDAVYMTARLYNFVGWEDADRTSCLPERDEKHTFQRYEQIGQTARQVNPDGTLGPIFALSSRVNRMTDLAFPMIKYGAPDFQPIADAINLALPRSPALKGKLPLPVDDARLVEPEVYEAIDKKWIAIIRDDKFSHRKYVSFSSDQGATWSRAMPTNIPDSPSLDSSVKAPDGSILLIGNHCATAFDNPQNPKHPSQNYHYGRDTLDIAVSRDGYVFHRAFALRTGEQAWRVPRRNVSGRGGGPQYPTSIIVGKRLYVMYSFGKEDIWCSSVPLSEILKTRQSKGAK